MLSSFTVEKNRGAGSYDIHSISTAGQPQLKKMNWKLGESCRIHLSKHKDSYVFRQDPLSLGSHKVKNFTCPVAMWLPGAAGIFFQQEDPAVPDSPWNHRQVPCLQEVPSAWCFCESAVLKAGCSCVPWTWVYDGANGRGLSQLNGESFTFLWSPQL